jgi:hypothetical protein
MRVLSDMMPSTQRPRILLDATRAGRVPVEDLPELIAFAWLHDDSPTSDITESDWLEIFGQPDSSPTRKAVAVRLPGSRSTVVLPLIASAACHGQMTVVLPACSDDAMLGTGRLHCIQRLSNRTRCSRFSGVRPRAGRWWWTSPASRTSRSLNNSQIPNPSGH